MPYPTSLPELSPSFTLDPSFYLDLPELLTAQQTHTDHPEEVEFIIYHQIFELRLLAGKEKIVRFVREANMSSSLEGWRGFLPRLHFLLQETYDNLDLFLACIDPKKMTEIRNELPITPGCKSFQLCQLQAMWNGPQYVRSRCGGGAIDSCYEFLQAFETHNVFALFQRANQEIKRDGEMKLLIRRITNLLNKQLPEAYAKCW